MSVDALVPCGCEAVGRECWHTDGIAFETRLGSWHAVNSFAEALWFRGQHLAQAARLLGEAPAPTVRSRRFGPMPGYFALLADALPTHNGGEVLPAMARRIGRQRDRFEQSASFGAKFVLFNADTDEPVATIRSGRPVWNALYGPEVWTRLADLAPPLPDWALFPAGLRDSDGCFAWSAEHGDEGIDEGGFFVRRRGDAQVLFRSTAFHQRLLTPADGPAPLARLADPVDRRAIDGVPALRDEFGQWPRRLRVERQPQWPHEYAGLLNALHHLCRLSSQYGQPIVWC